MILDILPGSENYTAQIVKINNLHPIPDADVIQRTVINGNDIVIPTTTKLGDEMIYFVAGTKLNEDYCKNNNLLDSASLNIDTSKKGFISHKQFRVKAIKLKGVISNGMLMPLQSVDSINLNSLSLKIGDEFNSIAGIVLCEKYIVPCRNGNPGGKDPNRDRTTNNLKDLLVRDQFRLHKDTAHFAKNLGKFNPTDDLVITRKYHGTSGISSHVLIQRKLSFIERLLVKFGVSIPKTQYGYIYSSGKPKSGLPKGVFNEDYASYLNPNKSFYKEDYWLTAFNKLKPSLEKGITLYYEVVGKGIQGDNYTYGFDHEIFVYRITQTNVDGITYEFSWQQVKDYCDKYGIKYVDELQKNVFHNFTTTPLQWLSDSYLNKSYADCKVDEGICIRNERTNEIFKLKSPNFILAENNMQEKDISNIEDEQ